MSPDPEGRPLLPVACTLGAADGAQRLDEWKRISGAAGMGREVTAGRLVLRFRGSPDVGEELERLVSAERLCCSFLGWDLVHVEGKWRVEISGSEDELRSLSIAE